MTTSFTTVPDRAVKKLGLRDGYALSLIARHCQMSDGVFKAGIENKAKALGFSPNLLRRAMRRLLADDLIEDLTPDLVNRPHEYRPTPKGIKLLVQNGRVKTAGSKWQGQNGSAKTNHEEYSSLKGTATTNHLNTSSSSTQTVLIENQNTQNLGALDIEAQRGLLALGIRADLRQSFRSAPDLVQRFTPAEILMFHDDNGDIARNLDAWREGWDEGANITDKPALIWAKIVEGQGPPGPAPANEPEMSDWLKEIAIR